MLALAFVLRFIGMVLDGTLHLVGIGANNLVSVARNVLWPFLISAALLLTAVTANNTHVRLHLASDANVCATSHYTGASCDDIPTYLAQDISDSTARGPNLNVESGCDTGFPVVKWMPTPWAGCRASTSSGTCSSH
jgi:hypothetical protein